MKVINIRDFAGGLEEAKRQGVIYCGRPSVLGNPCSVPEKPCPVCEKIHFGKRMAQLTECRSIECYRRWLWSRIKVKDQDLIRAITKLPENAVLGCWCSPKTCHCDVIISAWKWLRRND